MESDTDERIARWATEFALAQHLPQRRHSHIVRELYEVLDLSIAASTQQPRHLRHQSVSGYLQRLHALRSSKTGRAEAWRADILKWLASTDDFIGLAVSETFARA